MEDPAVLFLICLVLAMSVFLITLISTDAAIIFLIFSMLLSPEIGLGVVSNRAVAIRFDDLLLGVVFVTWLAKLAINKQLGFLRSTPLNAPLGMFIASYVASTAWGVLNGTVERPLASFFYFLKYFEYFFLFFMAANVIRERRQVERFLKAMAITAVCVCLYAYWQLLHYGMAYRVSAPFEGKAEPNTLAGYLVLMLAICGGLLLYTRSAFQRLALIGVMILIVPPFLYTYSRGGYLAFLVMYLTLCIVSTRYRPLLWGLLVLGIMVVPMILPATVFQRIASTFDPRGAIQVGGLRLAQSPAARLTVWRFIFERWKEHPILGFGVTGIGFVDSQYALEIGEGGLIGVAMTLWVRWQLFLIGYRAFRQGSGSLMKGLSLGFLAGFVGLLVHAMSGNVFIIVRIMEPFWFLTAVVTVLPSIVPPAASVPSVLNASRRLSVAPAGA